MGKQTSNWAFFRWLMLGLAGWALFVALGTYLGPHFWDAPKTDEDGQPVAQKSLTRQFDYRKPLIVIGAASLFLGGWGWLLRARQLRLAREAAAEQGLREVSKVQAKL